MRDLELEVDSFKNLLGRVQRPSARWYVGMLRASMALMRGRYDDAQRLGEEFLRDGLVAEDQNALHSFALQKAMMAVDVGGLEELEPSVAEMADRFPRVEGWQAGLCYLLSEIGKGAASRGVMDRLVAQGALRSFPRNAWFGTLGSLALASRSIGVAVYAAELYDLWVPFSGQMAVVGFSSFCWGSTDRFMGVLAGLLEQWDDAERHFQAAVAVNRGAGALPALAHTYADQAAMLDRMTPGRGRAHWERALDHARSLGMNRLERRILDSAI